MCRGAYVEPTDEPSDNDDECDCAGTCVCCDCDGTCVCCNCDGTCFCGDEVDRDCDCESTCYCDDACGCDEDYTCESHATATAANPVLNNYKPNNGYYMDVEN